MAFRKAANASELWPGEMKAVAVEDTKVVLVRTDAAIYAYEDRCAHLGIPLSEGRLDGTSLTCRAHHWEYDACTGGGVNPCNVALRSFPVRLSGDDVLVDVVGGER